MKLVALAAAVVMAGVVLDDGAPAGRTGTASVRPAVGLPSTPSAPTETSTATATAARDGTTSSTSELLVPADGGDGDSWRDTAGREYRLGLVNTPEHDECFGAAATAERRDRTGDGFRVTVYATDRYGRAVSVVTTADGRDLNVHLARNGFADDRFLAEFRGENEALARRLDAAFAAARREGKGLWSTCRAPAMPAGTRAPVPVTGTGPAGCHRDYATCVPVRGDGSGQGASDLDCGDVPGPVQVRRPGVDPYRFDADGDGTGCDS